MESGIDIQNLILQANSYKYILFPWTVKKKKKKQKKNKKKNTCYLLISLQSEICVRIYYKISS